MIPGDRGKVGTGWMVRPPHVVNLFTAGAEFTSSSGGVRAPSVTRMGAWRSGAIRNRSKPSQVIRVGFGPG